MAGKTAIAIGKSEAWSDGYKLNIYNSNQHVFIAGCAKLCLIGNPKYRVAGAVLVLLALLVAGV